MHFFLLMIVSLLTCAGQISQKQAVVCWQSDDKKPCKTILLLCIAVMMLGTGMLFWLKLLTILPLSIAYPMLSINFVIVTLIGQYVYKERVDKRHWFGIALIMLGIVLMSFQI